MNYEEPGYREKSGPKRLSMFTHFTSPQPLPAATCALDHPGTQITR
jgi:hypothetical protein